MAIQSTGVLQAAGVGSGIDIASLVSQLVAAERKPDDDRLSAAQSKASTQLSAVGQLKSALANFQSTLVGAVEAQRLPAAQGHGRRQQQDIFRNGRRHGAAGYLRDRGGYARQRPEAYLPGVRCSGRDDRQRPAHDHGRRSRHDHPDHGQQQHGGRNCRRHQLRRGQSRRARDGDHVLGRRSPRVDGHTHGRGQRIHHRRHRHDAGRHAIARITGLRRRHDQQPDAGYCGGGCVAPD